MFEFDMELEILLGIMGIAVVSPILSAYTGARMSGDFDEGKNTFFSRTFYHRFIKKSEKKRFTKY